VKNSIKEQTSSNNAAIYVAPRLAPTLSPFDLQEMKKKKENSQRQQHKLIKPIEEMYNELVDEAPQFVKKNRIGVREAQIISHEEETFTRLQLKKKDRIQIQKQRVHDERVDDWKDIQDISKVLKMQGLTETEGDYGVKPKKKKKQLANNPDLEEFGKKNRNKKIHKKVKK